jgi:hypothetical protein
MNEEIEVEKDENFDGIILRIPQDYDFGTLRIAKKIQFKIPRDKTESMIKQIQEVLR